MITREQAKQEVLPGWGALLDRIYDQKPDGVEIASVKEKYAALRVYRHITTAAVDALSAIADFDKLLDDIELLSLETCEMCGASGHVRDLNGWYKTLCPQCYLKRTGNAPDSELGTA